MPDEHPPLFNNSIPVMAVQDDNATVVIAEVPWGLHATGSSKREPTDQKNYARGYRLALARSLVNLGRVIERTERDAIRREIEAAAQAAEASENERVLKELEAERTRPEREAKAAKFRLAARRKARSAR